MDDEAKVWLPAFLEEIIDYFFSSEISEPESANIIFPEEMAASYLADDEKKWIVPVVSGPPAVTSFHYEIPNQEEVLEEDYLLELLQYWAAGYFRCSNPAIQVFVTRSCGEHSRKACSIGIYKGVGRQNC